jgi:hypothetical protein
VFVAFFLRAVAQAGRSATRAKESIVMEIRIDGIDPFYDEGVSFVRGDVTFREGAFLDDEKTPINTVQVTVFARVAPQTSLMELQSVLVEGAVQFLRRVLSDPAVVNPQPPHGQ